MVVVHESPLSMVGRIGFSDFAKASIFHLKMISLNTLTTNTIKMFESKKVILKEMLVHNSSWVAITMDMRTSSIKKKGIRAYYFIIRRIIMGFP